MRRIWMTWNRSILAESQAPRGQKKSFHCKIQSRCPLTSVDENALTRGVSD